MCPNIKEARSSQFLVEDTCEGYALPSIKLEEDKSTREIAADLLLKLTGLEAKIDNVGWVELSQGPIF